MKYLLTILVAVAIPVVVSADVFERVNNLREDRDLAPLVWKQELADAARLHAQYIYITGHWSHYTVTGKDYTIWMTNKYDYTIVGENIGRKFKREESMVFAWLLSKKHAKNIYDPFDETGVGTYGNVTVQLFGKLK